MESERITIYLVRHAQTSANEDCKNGDALEDSLTDLGRIQTNLLGMHLSNVNFHRVFSSDYTRAIETARGILRNSKNACDLEIEITEKLREVDLGAFEKRPYKELLVYCMGLEQSVHEWEFPEGESFPEAGQRLLGFIQDLCNQHWKRDKNDEECNTISPETFLIVSHSAVLCCFLTALLKDEQHEIIEFNPEDRKIMNNTCYMKLEISKNTVDEHSDEMTFPLRVEVLEKYYSQHLSCLKGCKTISKKGRGNNPILDFAKGEKDGRKFVDCVQQ